MNREKHKNLQKPNNTCRFRRIASFLLTLVLIVPLLLSLGCAKKPKTPLTTPEPLPTATAAPTAAGDPSVTVDQTVGYYFVDVNGSNTLYGGISFTNNGPVPVVISEASFTFRAGSSDLATQSFEPPAYKNDIVEPGETSSLALWMEYKGEKPSDPISVTATLTPQQAEGKTRKLKIENAFIADNYPSFSTVSGTVENPASDMDYSLSIIYLSFYDDKNKLLAVWHFTKDMNIPSQENRNFVMHMRSLPIPGLSALTKRIETRAFGI